MKIINFIALTVFMTASVAISGEALGDDFTFEAEEPLLRTWTFVVEASKVSRRDQDTLMKALVERVSVFDGYEGVTDKELQKAVGNKVWKEITRCKDAACLFPLVADATIDRLIVVRMIKDGGFITVDVALHDVLKREFLRAAPSVLEGVRDVDFLDEAVIEVLTIPKPVAVITPQVEVKLDDIGKEEQTQGEPFFSGDIGFYAVAGGGALMVTGGLFALLADTTQAEIQSQPRDKAAVEALISSGETKQLTANVLFGVGIAAILSGVILNWVSSEDTGAPASPSGGQGSPSRVRVDVAPTGATLSITY